MSPSETVFLGMDLAAVVALPTMLAMFAFALWFGATRAGVGIDEAEQARRMDAPGRF